MIWSTEVVDEIISGGSLVDSVPVLMLDAKLKPARISVDVLDELKSMQSGVFSRAMQKKASLKTKTDPILKGVTDENVTRAGFRVAAEPEPSDRFLSKCKVASLSVEARINCKVGQSKSLQGSA